MTNIYFGSDAVQKVEAAEGPLSSTERRIVELEGYADGRYEDTKGIATSGVGQTGAFEGMTFKDTVAQIENDARNMVPNFDNLTPRLQSEIVQAAYRGDLQQAPVTRALINAGRYNEAAAEFLNNEEFRNTEHDAIRQRMQDVSDALANEATPTPTQAAPTTGELKQDALKTRSIDKQQEAAARSEEKQLEVAGMSAKDISILNQGMNDYIRNGTEGTAATRAQEYMNAQESLNAVQARQEEDKSKVLFDDLDNPLEYTGNTLLSTVNTVGNLAGGLVSLPSTIRSAYNLSDATEEGFKQYQSILAKKAAGLELNPNEKAFEETDEYSSIHQGMESMARAQSIQGGFGILGDYVNQELTTEFVDEGTSLFNEVSKGDLSMGEFISESVNLLTSSPGALGQATVESLPYVLASAYNLPLTVASSWANNQQEALETFQKNNDGAIPTGRDLANLTMLSGGQSLVDHFGDRLVGGKNLTNLLSGATGKKAGAAIASTVTGTAGEFVAEGGAEVLGQLAGSAGKGNVDLATAYASGLLGAGSGGATAGSINVAHLTADAIDTIPEGTGEKLKSATEKVGGAVQAGKEAVSQAKEAVTTAATETAEETQETEEPKLSPREQADADAATIADAYNQDDEAAIEQVRPIFESAKADAQKVVQKVQQEQREPTTEEADTIGRYQVIAKARNEAVKARKSRKAAQQATQLATASTNSPAVQTAVQNVLGSIEIDPESVTADQATAILGNANLRLDTEQRSKLEHHVKVAKNLAEVSAEIRNGGNGNIGINQYIADVGTALEIGDVTDATVSLDSLKSWRDQHVSKLQSNVHNGKPMTKRLRAAVAKEVKAMNAAVDKLENDLLYVDAPTQEQQVDNFTQEGANADINVPDTSNSVGGTTSTAEESVAEQPATEQREEATVAEATQEEVTQELKEIFQKIDSDPALVEQVVNDTLDLNAQGVTFDSALSTLADQYGANTVKAAEEALTKMFPSTRDSLAGRMTTPEGGGLKVPVMDQQTKNGTAEDKKKWARGFNWVTAYYKPKSSKGNILQSAPGLLGGPMGTSIANFIGRDLTEAETNLVSDVQRTHGLFKKSYAKMSKETKKKDFRDTDPQLFLQEFEEENVRDAIWVAAYNWIATRGGDTLYNDAQTINTMTGRPDDAAVTPDLYQLLGKVGVGRNTLSSTLGGDIMDLLHIQTTGEAPFHLDSKMQNSVGLFALEIMRDMGVLKLNSVPQSELARFNPKATKEQLGSKVRNNYYRLATREVEGRDQALPSLRNMSELMRHANNSVPDTNKRMWTNTFGNISPVKAPSFSKISRVAKTVKGSTQKITKAEQGIIKRQQERKHFVRDDEWAAFSSLGREGMSSILGLTDPSEVHITKRETQENINASIERELNNFEDFVHMRDEAGKEHFYFTHSKWTNGRYGIEETLVNPQGIKSHRAFIGQEGWVATVDPAAEDNRWFWASMIEPLGIGSESKINADQQQVIDAMKVFVREKEFNPQDIDMIVNKMTTGKGMGHKAESFTALMNLAKYQVAKEDGTKFVTDMSIEIDGKTNGVILSMLQYADGKDASELLARLGKGGFYANGTYNNFEEFKKDGNKDAYEEIAEVWMKVIQDKAAQGGIDPKAFRGAQYIFDLIDTVIGEYGEEIYLKNSKGERNLAKSPLMVTNYGSGDLAVQDALAEDFLARIYDMITDAPHNYEYIAEQVNAIVPNAMPAKTDTPLEVEISAADQLRIKNFIIDEFGAPVSDAINDQYSRTKSGQKALNDTLDLMYRMHNAVREDLIAKATQQGIADGSIVEGVTALSAEKMKEIDEQIKVLQPQTKTFFSKANADFNHNMVLAGSRTAVKADSGIYQIEAQYVEGGNRAIGMTDIKVPSAPGVAGGVTTIHSLDALIMAKVYEGDVDVIGVHDAILVGIKDAQQGGEALNQATYDSMKEMTVSQEVLRSYAQARKAFGAYLGRADVDQNALMDNFYNANGEMLKYRRPNAGRGEQPLVGQKAAEARLSDIKGVAQRALQVKDEVLNTPNLVVHQYADEIGATGVTLNPTAVAEDLTETQVQNAGSSAARATEAVFDEAIYIANVPSPREKGSLANPVTLAAHNVSTRLGNIVNEKGNRSEMGSAASVLDRSFQGEITVPQNATDQEFLEAVANQAEKLDRPTARQRDLVDSLKNGSALGSAAVNETVSPSQYDSEQVVDATNVEEVFTNLPNTGGKQENEAHKLVLRERVAHFGQMIMNPFKLHMRTVEDAGNYGVMTDSDIYLTNLAEGATETSSMLARGIRMSNEEVMAHELNHMVYLEGLSKDSQERRVVERMFMAAREQLNHEVFLENPATASAEEVEGAKATFLHMFYERSGQSLAEFAAFGTTNEKMMAALEGVKVKPTSIFSGTIGEIFRKVLATIVDAISNRVLGLKGLSSDRKLVKLLDGMHRVNAKKRHSFIQAAEKASVAYQGIISKPLDLVRQAVEKAIKSDVILNNRFALIAGPAKAATAFESKKATEVMRDGFNAVRDTMVGTQTGFLATTFDEVIGRTKGNAAVRDLARTANVKLDQERKQVKTAMTQNVQNSFLTDMTDSDWIAVNKIFLKSDLNSLLGLGMPTIVEIMQNPTALTNLIAQTERRLVGNPNANFYIRQARNLGYFMNTGKSREKVALLNAHNISKVFGDSSVRVSDAAAANVEPIIDMLATLHALNEANPEQLAQANEILSREMAANVDNNGITAVLMAHAGLKEQSKAQFSTNAEYKTLAIKGWTKEVYKEGVALEAGTAADHDNLVNQGFIRGKAIANDPTDPVQEQRWIYHAPDGALAPYMSTIVSLTNNVAKGSNRKDVNKRWGADSPAQAADVDTLAINRSKLNAMKEMQARPNGPVGDSQENYMIPVVNTKGEIVDWRYMMSEANKDGLLQKENNAAEVLGSMAGNVVDKVESAKVNKEAVATLKKLYDAEYSKRSKAYVEVSPNAADGRHREIWHQIPEGMREEVRRVFGKDALPIRADLVTPMFGYRKYSLTEMFSKDKEARNYFERMVTEILGALFGKNAVKYVRNTENILQAASQEIKDIVIVKSGFVTLGNMLSNTMLLAMNGMSPARALRYQYEAYINSSEMIKEVRKVRDLSADLETKSLSTTQRRQREAEIARLNRRIAQNPTYEAYQAGMMPTIVDDAANETEFTNSMRGKFQRKVSDGIDSGLGFTPSWVREGVKTVVGLPDNELYRFLNNMVMQSDFVARHAMLRHWMDEKGIDESNPEWNELVGEATELFVNFDAPTHKGLQYLNDIGIAWFSKYVLRVNRSIARTFIKTPVSAIMTVLGVDLAGMAIDNPAASSVFGGGDPFRVLADPVSKALDATNATIIGQIVL